MLNFLVTNICGILPIDYFKYIVQFEDTLNADIWLIENGFNTEHLPFYKEEFECSPMNENLAKTLLNFSKDNHIKKFTLIESESYKVLCFTEQEKIRFTAERIQRNSNNESLEFTEVEPPFVFGFV